MPRTSQCRLIMRAGLVVVCATWCVTRAEPRIELRPRKSNTPYTLVGTDTINVEPGSSVELEIIFRGWGSAPGGPQLGALLATLDGSGFLGANANPAQPGVDLNPRGNTTECPQPLASSPSGVCAREAGAYFTFDTCLLTGADCSLSPGICSGVGNFCVDNARLVISCCNPLLGVLAETLDYGWGGASCIPDVGDVDPGVGADPLAYGYFGTLIVDTAANAATVYTLGFISDDTVTFMNDHHAAPITGVTLAPAKINVGRGTYWAPKNRHITFDPTPYAGQSVAFKVSRTFPPAGGIGWVGDPNANDVARVVAAPVTRTQWAAAAVHVGGCEIIPDAEYAIEPIGDSGPVGPPMTVSTNPRPSPKFWGDAVGIYDGARWTPPNGLVNINDVYTIAQTWVGVEPQRPHPAVSDIMGTSATDPCLNGVVNIADVFLELKAFQGNPYPFVTDPAMCPPCP
ncbi:MAG: hypothetical protein HY763_04975 [Planctomycetes bacterium]|nr:hypothetical protein [Planctomycetota bacterium]